MQIKNQLQYGLRKNSVIISQQRQKPVGMTIKVKRRDRTDHSSSKIVFNFLSTVTCHDVKDLVS